MARVIVPVGSIAVGIVVLLQVLVLVQLCIGTEGLAVTARVDV